MAHYAFLDDKNFVTEIIVGIDESELIEGLEPEKWYEQFRNQRCVRTSYNGKIRKNFAGVGFFYDEDKDAFIPIKPFDSWILDDEICQWKASIPYPDLPGNWNWNEESGEWQNG